MHRFLSKIRRNLATLLIAVMVIAPLSDAFECEFETGSPHAAVTADEGTTDTCDAAVDGERGHAACAHNHCHHASANVPTGLALVSCAFARDHALLFDDSLRFQDPSDGLMRPPRV